MKKTLIVILIAGSLFEACKKETKDVSTIVTVTHPTIALIGPAIYSTVVGTGTYTDPGAVAWDDLAQDSVYLTTPTKSNVNLTAPGFYNVTYRFTDAHGYYVSISRLILVTTVSPAQDISGTYARTSNGQTVTVTKKGTGLYTTDNVGGVPNDPDYIFDVYFGLTTDSTLELPEQPDLVGGGTLHGENTSVSISSADTVFSWKVVGSPAFGPAQRTFSHQ